MYGQSRAAPRQCGTYISGGGKTLSSVEEARTLVLRGAPTRVVGEILQPIQGGPDAETKGAALPILVETIHPYGLRGQTDWKGLSPFSTRVLSSGS